MKRPSAAKDPELCSNVGKALKEELTPVHHPPLIWNHELGLAQGTPGPSVP